MGLNRNQMMRNAEYIQQDMRKPVVYDGVAGFGSVGMIDLEQTLETIGQLTEYKFSVWLMPADFENKTFKPRTVITIDGVDYQILAGGVKDPERVLDRVDVGDVNG